MNNKQSATDQAVTAGVAALAVASKTPFRTAFKVMFGIGLAQLALVALFFGGGAAVITVGYLLLK